MASCFACNKISAWSSDKNESLNLPKVLAAKGVRNVMIWYQEDKQMSLRTSNKPINRICFGDVDDPLR